MATALVLFMISLSSFNSMIWVWMGVCVCLRGCSFCEGLETRACDFMVNIVSIITLFLHFPPLLVGITFHHIMVLLTLGCSVEWLCCGYFGERKKYAPESLLSEGEYFVW